MKQLDSNAAITNAKRPLIPRGVLPVAVVFVVSVVGFALVYFVLTRCDSGIVPTFGDASAYKPKTSELIGHSLHFSLVTISTLGYGDFRPISWARLVAGLEVLIGIVLMGILVSRLVSGQTEYLVSRVARSQINGELQEFRKLYTARQSDAGHLKADMPTAAQRGQFDADLLKLLTDSAGVARSVMKYWKYETSSAGFYEVVPLKAVSRLIGQMVDHIEAIDSILISFGADALSKNLKLRRQLRGLGERTLAVLQSVERSGTVEGGAHIAERARTVVRRWRKEYKLSKVPKELRGPGHG